MARREGVRLCLQRQLQTNQTLISFPSMVRKLCPSTMGSQKRGSGKNVIVIGSTNRPEAIDIALRRPGRFDREIELRVPDTEGRMEIFQIHTRGMPLAENVNLMDFAQITYAFVGADIAALCREAAMSSLRRILPKINLNEPVIPSEILDSLQVTREDFENALKDVQPSAIREILIVVPNFSWNDVGAWRK